MKRHIKFIYDKIDRLPVFGQYAYAAKTSYLTARKFQRFEYRVTPDLLWSTFWNASAYNVKTNSNAPLVIRKARLLIRL